PFIERICGEIQIHWVDYHVHVNAILDADSQHVPHARDHNLVFLQLDVRSFSLGDDVFLDVIIGRGNVTALARDVIEIILQLVVVDIWRNHVPCDVEPAKNHDKSDQCLYFSHSTSGESPSGP